MASNWTDVRNLKVQLDGGASEGVIFGNNLHCIAVTVSFVPTDAQNDKVSVTQAQLKGRVQLIDYVTGLPLPDGEPDWFYASSMSPFSATIPTPPGVARTVGDGAERAGDGTKSIKFYVFCGHNPSHRIKSIAASVSPDGSSITRNSALKFQGAESKVTLRALEPIVYKVSDDIQWVTSATTSLEQDWSYTKHTLSISSGDGLERYLHQASIVRGYRTEADGDGLGHSFYCIDGSFIAYAFAYGPERPETVYVFSESIPMKIGADSRSVLIAHLWKSAEPEDGYYDMPLAINVLDQYGNFGVFTVVPDYGVVSIHPPVLLDGKNLMAAAAS